MLPLRRIELVRPGEGFPFTLPVLREFEPLELTTPVTFFVGENGCGKSTLLEIIGAGLRLPALGQAAIESHPLMAAAVEAARSFRFVRSGSVRRGFFFRADDVTGFLQSVQRSMAEHDAIADELEASIPGDWGRTRAVGMAKAQSAALAERYGGDPFARSHGELYLDLFRSRITAPGVYLMDEPETPLSPTNQIALIAMIQDATERGSQFVVATHSPILMALPGATILDINESPPMPVDWDDVEHVSLTRAFLNHPESFLKHL
jgi:predicted ATPase